MPGQSPSSSPITLTNPLPAWVVIDATITIPSLLVTLATGNLIKGELGATVNARLGSAEDSYRWLMGEDATAFGGAIRDMWTPTCAGDPGKVTDAQYQCDVTKADGGGVHSNSGIPNHAFALLVDGGVFNGQTITALGLTKAAHIHWYAQTNYLTEASNFADHADALEAACTALIGVNLTSLSTGTSGAGALSDEIISSADCQEVAETVAAVEFHVDVAPLCGFTTVLQPKAPAFCANPEVAHTIFAEDWESGSLPSGWLAGTRAVADPVNFSVANWAVLGALPSGAPGGSTKAAFVGNPNIGTCAVGSIDYSGVLYLESPTFTIPAGVGVPRLAFDHWVATEAGYDGGNVKVSVNGGAWTLLPASAYSFNAYNTSLETIDNTNPMAGEAAFTGADVGSNGGSWGQSQIDLSGIVAAGDSVKLRFEQGQDGCTGVTGWYVDDVRSFFCSVPADVGIAKTIAPALSEPGGAVTYTLSFSNDGPGIAIGVVVADSVPVSVSITGVISSPVGSGVVITQTGGSPAFAWAVSELAVGAGGIITLTGTLSNSAAIYGTQFVNTATITASNDSTASNNSSGAGLTVPFLLTTSTTGTGSGSLGLDPAGGVYSYGTVVTVTAVANTGSTFTGWDGAVVSAANPVTLTMDGNKTITGTFTLGQLCADHGHGRYGQRFGQPRPGGWRLLVRHRGDGDGHLKPWLDLRRLERRRGECNQPGHADDGRQQGRHRHLHVGQLYADHGHGRYGQRFGQPRPIRWRLLVRHRGNGDGGRKHRLDLHRLERRRGECNQPGHADDGRQQGRHRDFHAGQLCADHGHGWHRQRFGQPRPGGWRLLVRHRGDGDGHLKPRLDLRRLERGRGECNQPGHVDDGRQQDHHRDFHTRTAIR